MAGGKFGEFSESSVIKPSKFLLIIITLWLNLSIRQTLITVKFAKLSRRQTFPLYGILYGERLLGWIVFHNFKFLVFTSYLLKMPHHCIVPLCTNNSSMPGLSFHRLPLHNENLLTKWLVNIKIVNTPANEYSRICSEHFEEGNG